jgi:hypothetical protein
VTAAIRFINQPVETVAAESGPVAQIGRFGREHFWILLQKRRHGAAFLLRNRFRSPKRQGVSA